MAKIRVQCSCGGKYDSRVWKQHARKCDVQLQCWADDGANMALLDERSEKRKAAKPLVLPAES